MFRYVFAVAERAYCCWEHDLPERNRRFLASVETEYFSYLALAHGASLDGADEQKAAVALRAAYHHGLETLFTLLGALVQAPDAVPAWAIKCQTAQLRDVTTALLHGQSILTQLGRQSITFDAVSELVHRGCWEDTPGIQSTTSRFSRLWSRLAGELLDESNIAEYNSIKHGFRLSAGGTIIRIGAESEYGVMAAPEAMRTIGSSPHGSRFFRSEPIVGAENAKHNFRIRRASLNWRAEAMVQRLHLIAYSINNVVACLRCLHGEALDTVPFHRPEDDGLFDSAWQWGVGVTVADFDTVVQAEGDTPASHAELLAELESRSPSELV